MPKSFATEGLQKPPAPTTPLVHLQVPPGMDAALRGLTREVLRRQPSDLYLFAHRYFESLLADRVAKQTGEDVSDAESLYSKKQSKHSESSYTLSSSMREFFRDDQSKREEGSRERVHQIHLEDDYSPKKNVVHNINIEVEDEDASIGETTVKVEITDDGGKRREKKRSERDTTSFEEEVTRTRTEHVTVRKSWKVETRVETSDSGEIRVVESFTDGGKSHGKTKQSSKPRKFASEEEKKSKSLIEEERRAAKAEREKAKKVSSKSKSFESVDKSATTELIALERQAGAQKFKPDEGKKYKSFIRLDEDESAKSQSERLIEIEREDDEVLTRFRRDVDDSTREASPDSSLLQQSPQVALKKMEESLIQLKELEKKDEAQTKVERESLEKFSSKAENDIKSPVLASPKDALNQMEKSLIKLKETSFANETETRTGDTDEQVGEVSSSREKGKSSLDEKQTVSIKSEDESKSSISEEKHKIMENVKEIVHKIEEKASSVLSHIHGSQSLSLEEKQSTSMKSEDDSKSSHISEEKHKIMENVKEVVQEIEEKTSSVLSHFPEKTGSSVEKTDVLDLNPDDKESIDIEAQKVEEVVEKRLESESPADKTEVLDLNANDNESIAVEAQIEETDKKSPELEKTESSAEKTEDLDSNTDDKESNVVGAQIEGKSPEPEKTDSSDEKTEAIDLIPDDKESIIVEAQVKKENSGEGIEEKALVLEEKTLEEFNVKKGEEDKRELNGIQIVESKDLRVEEDNVSESKTLHKREVEESSTEAGKEEIKEHDSEVGGLEEESTEEKLVRQSSKTMEDDIVLQEKGRTSPQSLKEDSSTKMEEKQTTPVEDLTKDADKSDDKSSKKPLEEREEQNADISLEKEESKNVVAGEALGQEPKERIAGERPEIESARVLLEREKSEEKEEAILRSTQSESKDATETIEKSEVEDVKVDEREGKFVRTGTYEQEEVQTKTGIVSKAGNLEESPSQLEVEAQIEKDVVETKSSPQKDSLDDEKAATEPIVEKDAPLDDSVIPRELSIEKEETARNEPTAEPEADSSEQAKEEEEPQESLSKTAKEQETGPAETTTHKEKPPVTQEVRRVRRSTEETFRKTEELSESISTSVMTKTIILEGPEQEIKREEIQVTEHQEEKSQTKTEEVKKDQIDIEDVFGNKTYPIEDVDTLLGTTGNQKNQEGAVSIQEGDQRQISAEKIDVPLPVESSSEEEIKEDDAEKSKKEKEAPKTESSEEMPVQRKLASLDEESSSVSEGTGDGFLPPTVVISRVADVVELTDGEAKIVSQMEKEGLTTEYDENSKMKTGYWSAEDANKFIAGESQHTYHTLRKPKLFYSDLNEARPPEKSITEESEKDAEEIESLSAEYVVEEQEESSPDKTDSLGQDSDSKEGPVKFSLVEVDNDEEIKEKPWLARAHTVEEIFEKRTAGEPIPVTPTPPRRRSVPGHVDVMMEMSKATSRIGQSIMVLSGGEKRPVQRADSDEYCISEDAIYIPLKPQGAEPDTVEESDDEPFRIDQPPPTFIYDSDEGEWGAALAEHIKKQPSLTTVIIERKVDDPTALGRVTITEITDEEAKAMTQEHTKESKVAEVEELPKPVFEIGSPVSDRSTDPNELRTDAKHRPSLADISEENLESVDDNEASMNVELHISLSDGDNLSQRSYGTESERKWTEDLSNVASKAKDAATGMIKNIFGSSPRKDRQSPAGSESSITSEAESDGKKTTRTRSESKEGNKEESDKVTEPLARSVTVEGERKSVQETRKKEVKEKPAESVSARSSEDSAKHADTKERDEASPAEEKGIDDKTERIKKETKSKTSRRDEDKPALCSLQESNQTTPESLTSVSLPLPDASYDVQNETSITSETPGGTDMNDTSGVFEVEVQSEKEDHHKDESRRSKRSVEHEEVQDETKLKEDEDKMAEGSGAAAGSAVQKAAEEAEDEHKKEDHGVSAKDEKETGPAGQEPVSDPKDSMTSAISETLDSVESLPSEVSKNLWSIEDVPLAENLNETGLQTEKVTADELENIAARDSERKEDKEADVRLKGSPTTSEVVDDVKDTIDEVKGEEEHVRILAQTTKDVRHKLARGAEVAQESLEDVIKEKENLETEIGEELQEKSDTVKDAVTTMMDNVVGEIKDVRDNVEKTVKDAEEKAEQSKAEVQEKAEEGKTKLDGMIDSVGEAISGVKERITSVFKEGEHKVEEIEEKPSKRVDAISAEVTENVIDFEDKVEKGKSELSKFMEGVGDAKEKIAEKVTHVKDEVKSFVSDSEKRVEDEIIEIKETAEEKAERIESGIEKKVKDAGLKIKQESEKLDNKVVELVDSVGSRVQEEKDKVKEISEVAGDKLMQVKDKISEKVEKVEDKVAEVADKTEEKGKRLDTENTAESGEKLADSLSEKELDEVEKRLSESIERQDDGIDTVNTHKIESEKNKIDEKEPESKTTVAEESKTEKAEVTSTTKMVLDKRKIEEEKPERKGVEILGVSARSLGIPEDILAGESEKDDPKTDSSGKEGSSEARRTKRHVLKRADTLKEAPQSADTIPSESVDEVSTKSADRMDTVVHVTLDEPDAPREATRQEEEVIVPIHVEFQAATPVPPGKDTKATETDLLEKETVSRGTEPEETTEQIAEALKSEVKDLEERLSRLRESTWSLSHAGASPRKGEEAVHASKSNVEWNPDDLTERTIHVKKSVSSAESMSFASRVLSTPMGSVREEYSEMKKSTAETTHETILTVDKGVQSEGGETGKDGTGDSGPERRTTVTTATQVSVPSDESSDKEARRALFQRAKSMDAKTEARAITNFSKRTYEAQKTDSSKTEQQSEPAKL